MGFLIGATSAVVRKPSSWLLIILAAVLLLAMVATRATDDQAIKSVIGLSCGFVVVLIVFCWIDYFLNGRIQQ